MDLRTLALFRILLATLLLVDLVSRSADLVAHYSDQGVLPRAALLSEFLDPWGLSLHLATGQATLEGILFCIAGLVALMLLVGYQSRLAVVVSWILLISLHARNPAILQRGDVLLRMLLFWSMFLPLHARYSVDSALSRVGRLSKAVLPDEYCSMGTVGLLLQVIVMYVATYFFKTGQPWQDGTAIFITLSADQYATPLGTALLQFPEMLQLMTVLILKFELLGPLLLLSPVYSGVIRTVTTFLFYGLQTGFGVLMTLGMFPFISMTASTVFLPGWFWEKGVLPRLHQPKLLVYSDPTDQALQRALALLQTFLILPGNVFLSNETGEKTWYVTDADGNVHQGAQALKILFQESPLFHGISPLLRWTLFAGWGKKLYAFRVSQSLGKRLLLGLKADLTLSQTITLRPSILGNGLATLALVYILMWNLQTLNPALGKLVQFDRLAWLAHLFRWEQKWSMFALANGRATGGNGWFVIPARLVNGAEPDLYPALWNRFQYGKRLSWNKPKSGIIPPNFRWRKLLLLLRGRTNTYYRPLRHYLSDYLCQEWNHRHPKLEQIQTLRLIFIEEVISAELKKTYQPQVLWEQPCSEKSAEVRVDLFNL